ncbi:MAG: hypothetical protein PUD91_00830 [Bacteroidales bacterium]|nr:hypothetical protein [Bacteroidales bacterium]
MKNFIIIIASIIMALASHAAQPQAQAQGLRHFAWGIDVGSSIDLSGNDLSSIDISTYFGYKNSVIRTLGVGVDLRNSLGNSCTMIPVYAMLRTNFSSALTLCFADIRSGYSFNSLNTAAKSNGLFLSAGLGFNLYTSATVHSHIILSYSYNDLKPDDSLGFPRFTHSLSAMSVKIGVNF